MIRKLRRAARNAVLGVLGIGYRIAELSRRDRPVIVYYAWRDFERKARALADVLRRAGVNVEVRSGNSMFDRARVRNSRLLHVGFWNGFYLDFLPAKYIFYNAEPLALPRWKEDLEWTNAMRGAYRVWGYAANNAEYVEPLGVPFRFVPFGYAEYYEAVHQASIAGQVIEEDVDVLFVGHLTDRRKELVRCIEQLGLHVTTVTFDNPLHGAALDRMYARSKIILSIFRSDDANSQVVDSARIDSLLANARFVIHEQPAEGSRDLELERHVVTCTFNDIPAQCAYFVRASEERRQRAVAARLWYRTNRAWGAVLPLEDLRAFVPLR